MEASEDEVSRRYVAFYAERGLVWIARAGFPAPNWLSWYCPGPLSGTGRYAVFAMSRLGWRRMRDDAGA